MEYFIEIKDETKTWTQTVQIFHIQIWKTLGNHRSGIGWKKGKKKMENDCYYLLFESSDKQFWLLISIDGVCDHIFSFVSNSTKCISLFTQYSSSSSSNKSHYSVFDLVHFMQLIRFHIISRTIFLFLFFPLFALFGVHIRLHHEHQKSHFSIRFV